MKPPNEVRDASTAARIQWAKQMAKDSLSRQPSEHELSMLGRAPWDKAIKWLWEYLSASAPEFSQDVTEKAYLDHKWPMNVTLTTRSMWAEGARWQYEQIKTQIACVLVHNGGLANKVMKLEEERDKWKLACQEAVRRLALE